MKVQIKNQKAITLIALIITIILLLILAGVAISALGGNDGLLAKVEKAKIEQMKAEAKENIELAIIEIQTQEIYKGTDVTLQTLNDKLNEVDNRIEPQDYTEGDTELIGLYTVNNNTKLSFEIDENLNVIIGEVVKEGKTFPITVTEIETTSLRVTGDVSSLETPAVRYTYVAETSASNQIKFENITDTSYPVTGLEPGTKYKVYMLAYDNAGNETKSNVETVTTKSMPDGTKEGAITFSSITWTSGKAGVTISTNETSYYIEYQVNGTEGTWTKASTLGASVTLNNLNNNDVINARLTDGTYSGEYATLTVADTKDPEAFTIKVTNTSATSIKIEGSTTDTDSGLKDYSYYVKTSNGTVVNQKEHTPDTSWEVTGLTTGTEYTVYMIAYDNAENETPSEEKKITVQKPIAYAPAGVVQYDAGTWTQPEIDALDDLYNENSSHEANASLNLTFGGFKAGDSRNSSVSCGGFNGYGTTPTYEGWIVLESEENNGKTYIKSIVHAGAPENFVYYYTTDNDAYRDEYILSSGQRQQGYSTDKGYRNWDKYKDQSKLNLIDSVHCMTKIDANKLPDYNARKTGAYYWLDCSYYDRCLWYVDIDGVLVFNDVDDCWGVRPVVTFVDGVYAVGGDGTPGNPFVLGKD